MDRASAESERVVEFRGSLRRGTSELFSLRAGSLRAWMRASTTELVLGVDLSLEPDIVLKRELVRSIRTAGLLRMSVQIEHADPAQPAYLVFRPFDVQLVCEELRALGYPVE